MQLTKLLIALSSRRSLEDLNGLRVTPAMESGITDHVWTMRELLAGNQVSRVKSFTIYPKDGEPFSLLCERFQIKDDRVLLYNEVNEESHEGFLSYRDVAAIVPEQLAKDRNPYPKKPITFFVYLRDKVQPIEILAHTFKIENQSSVTFFGQRRDMLGNLQGEWPIDDVYVAASELIAIVPDGGLISRW